MGARHCTHQSPYARWQRYARWRRAVYLRYSGTSRKANTGLVHAQYFLSVEDTEVRARIIIQGHPRFSTIRRKRSATRVFYGSAKRLSRIGYEAITFRRSRVYS
jgi:hypothetical protein